MTIILVYSSSSTSDGQPSDVTCLMKTFTYLASLRLVLWPGLPWLQPLGYEELEASQARRLPALHAHITRQSCISLQVGISSLVLGFGDCWAALPDHARSSGSYRHVHHSISSVAVQSGDGIRLRSPSSSLLFSCPALLRGWTLLLRGSLPWFFLDLSRSNVVAHSPGGIVNSFQTTAGSNVLKMVIKGFVD